MKHSRVIRRFCIALVLFSGFFSSCEKRSTLTVYHFHCNWAGTTVPAEIEDPDLRDLYSPLLQDFLTDLTKLELEDVWNVWAVNRRFGVEDAKAEAEYDKRLPAVKEIESRYKKRIAEIELQSESSFIIIVVYKLSRSVPADYSPSLNLREYSFELKYN